MIKFIKTAVNPKRLNVIGSIQADLTREILESMICKMQEGQFDWEKARQNDGYIEIWEIRGRRYLANGNHRYHAAEVVGIEIPGGQVIIINKGKIEVPTFLRKNMNIID